jgi:FkbM family methyltransferase
MVGKCLRQVLHVAYGLRHRNGKPVRYRLAEEINIQLYPEGEVAEFLAVQQFFERSEMGLTAAYLKPGMKVIDVGANIGVYSILAQQCVGETGFIWAFEPSTESFQRLLKNIDLNRCNRIRPVRMALSDRSDTHLALRSDPGFGDAYRYLVSDKAANCNEDEIVPATTLDLYTTQNGIVGADYIKVDVEGCEYMVFAGARELLASSRDVVVMFESEADWCERAGFRQHDTFELLRKFDFGLFAWDNRSRKWKSDNSSLLKSSTVWAARNMGSLPVL